MNSTVKEWVTKAQADFAMASREMRAGQGRNNDGIYFHAQQCVEKLMKAVLTDRGDVPPKTHELVVLGKLISEREPSWSWNAEELRFLTQGAVILRYPGDTADARGAREAMKYARNLRESLLNLLQKRPPAIPLAGAPDPAPPDGGTPGRAARGHRTTSK
jgi:HEPN domain-containing protein